MISRRTTSQISRILLVGGGHTHMLLIREWAIAPVPDVELILVSESEHTPYSGMLPGHIAGLYTYEECHINLRQITQNAHVEMLVDRVVGLDLSAKIAICQSSPPLPFDIVSIDIGSTPRVPSLADTHNYGVPIKPVSEFLRVWQTWLNSLPPERNQESDRKRNPTRTHSLGIIGGGAGGIELALAMDTRLRMRGMDNFTIRLFHQGKSLLSNSSPQIQYHFTHVLAARKIQVHLDAQVSRLTAHSNSTQSQTQSQIWVECQSGDRVSCDRVFWVTHATAPAWLQQTGLELDPQGFILVKETLQSVSCPYVFAAGDIASLDLNPCPKAGVFAVRQAKPLWNNIQRFLKGQTLQPYRPQKRYLSLIGTGVVRDRNGQWQPQAIASWGTLTWGPATWIWRWKDWIDQRFMQKFLVSRDR